MAVDKGQEEADRIVKASMKMLMDHPDVTPADGMVAFLKMGFSVFSSMASVARLGDEKIPPIKVEHDEILLELKDIKE